MRIVEISADEGIVMTGGLRRKANLSLLKGAKVGDYILMHAGFAIERVNEREAKATLKVLKRIKI